MNLSPLSNDFERAQNAFLNLIGHLDCEHKAKFLLWCKEFCTADCSYSEAHVNLRTIAEDIKTLIPTEAILPSEKVDHSSIVNNNHDNNGPVIHVDSFLFEDEDMDNLVEEGRLSRNYCKKCGSFEVAPITFISHSASVQRIEFIFKYMLPDLSCKVLLDVGSRLGAILYGAYYCSSAQKIIGVEINEDLCKLQKHIVSKYGLSDRIEIICSDICKVPEVINAANVIILNNVFECFMPRELQEKVWIWLRNCIKQGTILVTVPSIEETLSKLQTGIDVCTWLEKASVTNPEVVPEMDDNDLLSEICMYFVK